jgi:hypothetical protein
MTARPPEDLRCCEVGAVGLTTLANRFAIRHCESSIVRARSSCRTTMRNETHQTADIDRNRTVVTYAREAQPNDTGPPHAGGRLERTGCPLVVRPYLISLSCATRSIDIAGLDDRDRPSDLVLDRESEPHIYPAPTWVLNPAPQELPAVRLNDMQRAA